MPHKVPQNPAALCAAVFSLSAKNLRGGGCTNPPVRARVNTYIHTYILLGLSIAHLAVGIRHQPWEISRFPTLPQQVTGDRWRCCWRCTYCAIMWQGESENSHRIERASPAGQLASQPVSQSAGQLASQTAGRSASPTSSSHHLCPMSHAAQTAERFSHLAESNGISRDGNSYHGAAEPPRPASGTLGQRYTETGQRYTETGQRYTETGQRYTETGQWYTETGQRYTETGQRYTETGQRYTETGQRYTETGQRYTETGQRNTKTGQRYTRTRTGPLQWYVHWTERGSDQNGWPLLWRYGLSSSMAGRIVKQMIV